MKLRLSLIPFLLIAVVACSAPPPTAPTTAPDVSSTSLPPTQPPATAVAPTNTSAPAATAPAPTEPPSAPLDTLAPQPTDTATSAPVATKSRPTPTSAGPLTAAIYAANCRSAPTAEKPGRIIVQISVEASGGNGRYRYFYQDKEFPTKFIDVIGEKGTRLINEVRVTSGDGQEIKKEFDIPVSQLTCP